MPPPIGFLSRSIWYGETLAYYRPDTDDVIQLAGETGSEDVLIAISLHRYVKATIQMAEMIRQRGTFVIGLTDSRVAPLSATSDVTLTVSQPVTSTIDAAPALFSLINGLFGGVVIRNRERFEQRRAAYEALPVEDLFVQEES